MRRTRIQNAVVQVILTTAFSLPLYATEIAELAWLSGCWQSDGSHRQVTEHWMKPEGGTMLGMNRTISGGKTAAYEFMRIEQEENGDIYYVAQPSGQKEARFKLTKAADDEAIFENPEHDFPQRVIYRKREDGSLLGRIEGERDEEETVIDFPMQRVSCEG